MLGREEQVSALADTERLVEIYHPAEPQNPQGITGFAQALADFIKPPIKHPSGAHTQTAADLFGGG